MRISYKLKDTPKILFTIIIKPSLADEVILLENRNPNYWEYLSPQAGEELYADGSRIITPVNLFITNVSNISNDGITLSTTWNGLVVSGLSSKKQIFNITNNLDLKKKHTK